MAGLCYDQKEYAKSLKYYKACLEETEESMLSNYKQFKTIKDLYIYVRSKHKKLPSDLRDQEIILIRRYSSLINTMFLCAKESEYPQLIEHMQTLLLILKDRPMDHRYIRTVLKMTDLTIRRGDYHQAWEHLVYCERLISDYDDLYNTQLRLQNSKTVEKRP